MRAVRDVMLELNDIGADLSAVDAVRSMTDVTGFGLLGHLIEMCEASGVSAEVSFESVRRLGGLSGYIEQGCVPGGTSRNFQSYGDKVTPMTREQQAILCDPQTSGGLLISVDPARRESFLSVTRQRGLEMVPFGRLTESSTPRVRVR
jgi:selenide,water dikinase